MATKKAGDRVAGVIKEVEAIAKGLRTDIRKRAKAAPKELERAAQRLSKRAASVAGLVEKYAHEARLELEGAASRKKPARRRRRAATKKR